MNISLLRLTGKMNHTIYQRFLNLGRALWATTYLASRVDSSDLLLLYLFLEVDLPENHLGGRSFLLKYCYYYYYYYTQLGADDRFAIRILLGQEKDRGSWKAVQSFSWSCDLHEHSFFAMCVELTRMTKLHHIYYKINVTAEKGGSFKSFIL